MYLPGLHAQKNAFTLVELMISVSILAILTGALIPSFSSYINDQSLKQGQELVKSDLRTAQNNALNGSGSSEDVLAGAGTTNPTHWAIVFENGQQNYHFYITASLSCPPSATLSLLKGNSPPLPSDIRLANVDATTCVFFSFENGDATAKNIYVTNAAGSKKECVGVNANGLIFSGTWNSSDNSCQLL